LGSDGHLPNSKQVPMWGEKKKTRSGEGKRDCPPDNGKPHKVKDPKKVARPYGPKERLGSAQIRKDFTQKKEEAAT